MGQRMSKVFSPQDASGTEILQEASDSPPEVGPSQQPGRLRVAWLIGQQNYSSGSGFSPLGNPVHDVGALGETLRRKCGFQVTNLADVTRSKFGSLPKLLAQSLQGQQEAVLLLYYAGHALSCNSQTFLVPTDAERGDPASCVNLNDLVRDVHDIAGGSVNSMQRAASQVSAEPAPRSLVLIVLDSCREWPAAGPTGWKTALLTATRKYRPVDTEMCVVFACDEGKGARESQQVRHGVFTHAFIRALEVPGKNWFQVFEACRDSCIKESRGMQRPWMYFSTSRAGELILHQDPH